MKVTIEDGCITINRDFQGPIEDNLYKIEGATIQELVVIGSLDETILSQLLAKLRPLPSTPTYVRSWRYIDMRRFRHIDTFPIDP